MKTLLMAQAEANRYINRQWLEALSSLSQAELDRPQGAFFGTIFGTFNHILLGDRIWLGRIQGRPFGFDRLSHRICETMEHFTAERATTDQELIDLVSGENDFERRIDYRDNRGKPDGQPLYQIMAHLFAHQNHHRGHISQMCHERGIAIPDGGYIAYFRSGAAGSR